MVLDSMTSIERNLIQMGNGDPQALAALYGETSSAVFGFALSILRDKHNAEDVMQETYIRAFAAAKGYTPQGKPMAFLLTIARNLSLMKLREHENKHRSTEEAWDLSDPRDETEESLDRLVLHAAMKLLSDEENQIIVLHSVTGLKHREIAEILQIPLSTALSKYHRGLSKLKSFMKEDE